MRMPEWLAAALNWTVGISLFLIIIGCGWYAIWRAPY